jgi:hypothetical protein
VRIRGHPDDFTGNPKVETDYVKDNGELGNFYSGYSTVMAGFNPSWRKTFTFNIRVPDLAMVEFKVI